MTKNKYYLGHFDFLHEPWEMKTPLPCPNCGEKPKKGVGALGGRNIDQNAFGHRYGRFCSLRCGASFANKFLAE